MRRPSRTMPPASPPPPISPVGWLILALFAALPLFPIVRNLSFGLTFYALLALAVLPLLIAGRLTNPHDKRLARLAANRPDESICTFVRGFDYRSIDTWILRAVHDELQPHCRYRGGVLPLRPTDELDRDLKIDPEELTVIAETIAERTGRSFDDIERNPYYNRVHTVANLVHFFNHQPLIRPR